MNDPQTLQDLVHEAKRKRGTSVRQLAFIAHDHGYKVTHTTLNAIASGTYKSEPREVTVRAIAWLAGVSVEDAFTAAGLPVPGPPFADELPPGVDYLSPKARRAVIELLRVLVDEEAGEELEDRSAPMNPARESRAPKRVVHLGDHRETERDEPLQTRADAADDGGGYDHEDEDARREETP